MRSDARPSRARGSDDVADEVLTHVCGDGECPTGGDCSAAYDWTVDCSNGEVRIDGKVYGGCGPASFRVAQR